MRGRRRGADRGSEPHPVLELRSPALTDWTALEAPTYFRRLPARPEALEGLRAFLDFPIEVFAELDAAHTLLGALLRVR